MSTRGFSGGSVVVSVQPEFVEAVAGFRNNGVHHQGEIVEKAEGAFNAQQGAYPGAQLALTTGPTVRAAITGEIARATAVFSDEMFLSGDELLGKKFAVYFRV